MTSPRPGGTPASRAVNASKTPATGGTPLGDDAIWKRLKESGLDEESVKRRDKATLISYITKLESEIYEYQHHMGLLILERKELVSKYEQVKASSDSAEIAYKREEAKRSSALAEARKRELNLEKLLGIQKECVANIEKALHDNLVESAERKLGYESKIAEAHAMMTAAQEKLDEAEKKLLAAESLQAEANRTRNTAIRTLDDVEAREDELRRRLATFKSQCDAKENEISIQRQALYESQKTLHQQQERFLEGQTLLNQREEYIFERTKELNRIEKELEESKANIEEESRTLKLERSNLDLEIAALRNREEVIVKRESMLDKRERELLILQEKIACREHDEIQRIMEEHQSILEKKKSELEADIEQRHLLLKNELEARKIACEIREADLCSREVSLQEKEHAIELQSSVLAKKQEDVANKLRLLEEKEHNLSSTKREAEIEVQNMQKEREIFLKMKVDLEKTKAVLEDEKKEIILAEEKFEITLGERNELLLLENKLKEEIDSLRAQKLALVAEADILKAEKEKFEIEWEMIDEKREDLQKEAERIDEERKTLAQYLKNEHDSIKLEKENLHNQFKRDVERLSCEREEFICEMDRQHSDWFTKMQQERENFTKDIGIQRNELENSINERREEIETYLREKEESFEKDKVKELQLINSQKDMIAKQLEHVASEMQKLNTERLEIAQDREQREREWADIKRFTEALDLQCEKLQKQRELLHAEREEINQKIQQLKKLEELQIESENRALSVMQTDKCDASVGKSCQCINGADRHIATPNGVSTMKLLPQGTPNPSTPTSVTKSWIKKCSEAMFKHSPEKDSDTGHEENVESKMLAKSRDFRFSEMDLQGHGNFAEGKEVSVQEMDNFTPKRTKSNRQEKVNGQEIKCVRCNFDEQNMISDARPVAKSAQSPSEVGANSIKFNQALEDSGQKSRTLFSSINSWISRRKRSNDMLSHDHADMDSEPNPKQQKRPRQNGNSDVEGDSSNGLAEQQPNIDDECEPLLRNQTSGCEQLHAVAFKDQQHENMVVPNAEPIESSQHKLAVSNFDIVENGKFCKFEHSPLAGVGAATSSDANEISMKDKQVFDKEHIARKPSQETSVSASDLIVKDNDKLKEQDRYNEVLDELEDEDDGSGLSVKEKIWNFLIT
ncbi:unnamed protein product [Musa acuminata subsp. burmannicoides]